jgi:hypothetical protein
MAFTTCSVATNNIASLDDLPNDVGGLTAAQLKAKFDQFGADFVAWFNETHIAEADAHVDSKAPHPNVPAARVYNSASQSIPNNTDTVLAFDTELFDTDAMHDNVNNNTRLTCKTAGNYLIIANVGFTSNATGFRKLYLKINGSINDGLVSAMSVNGDQTFLATSVLRSMAVNDYVEAYVKQTSGEPLNAVSGIITSFNMVRVG